jgi:protein phosphatase 1 regulatory subunit 7
MKTARIEKWIRWKILWLRDSETTSAGKLMSEFGVEGLGLSPYRGFRRSDLSFLLRIDSLVGLVTPFAKDYDLSVVETMPHLRFLSFAENRQPLNLSALEALENLRVHWHSKLVLPTEKCGLRDCYMRGFHKSLQEIPAYRNLQTLELKQGSITSLDGIEMSSTLKSARFIFLTKLVSVEAVSKLKVEELEFDTCKAVKDWESLAACKRLQVLKLNNCGSIPSLKWIRNLRSLKELRFVSTNIEDGDLSPLLNLKLKAVGFSDMRHFSHTMDDVVKAIGSDSAPEVQSGR